MAVVVWRSFIFVIVEEEEIPMSALNELKKAINLIPSGGVLELDNKIYDLHNTTTNIDKPIKIVGEGKIINGCIMIKNTSDVIIRDVETESLFIKISSSANITIENCKFNELISDVQGFISFEGSCNDIKLLNNIFKNVSYISSSSTYGCGIKIEINNDNSVTTMDNITISNNYFSNIHGPAAIWIGGYNVTYNDLVIDSNEIKDTESFGIEFYHVDNKIKGKLKFNNCFVTNNNICDIGSVRERNKGAGCGGIYNNITESGIYVINNEVKRVREVGIEGFYSLVQGNYIEDTGCDQLNHPIKDSAGIYDGGDNIIDNTIINPGCYGGIHYYSANIIKNKIISGNKIANVYERWQPDTFYNVGALVVSKDNWYVCVMEGTSGNKEINGEGENIVDGTCIWNYKKPLAKIGVNLNGVLGISNIEIVNNTANDFNIFASMSGFVSDIKIYDNLYTGKNLNDYIKFLSGYGSRICKNLVVEDNRIQAIGLLDQ